MFETADWGLLGASLILGLRHGIDWDHIAAITDISATERSARRAFTLGSVYVVGHAAVVLVLGVIVITFGSVIPDSFDAFMGGIVGWTLVVLGVYVLIGLVRHRGQVRLRSRWMLLFDAVRALRLFLGRVMGASTRVVEHTHRHSASDGVHHLPPDSAEGVDNGAFRGATHTHAHAHSHDLDTGYSSRATALIGMLHGIGAETPTQIVVFLAAANAGGVGAGMAVLVVFIAGLILSNTAITLLSVVGFAATRDRRRLYVILGTVSALASIGVGMVLIAGQDSVLPTFFSG